MNRPIRDGFFLVARHQRIVWWIFFVNLLLGFLASVTPRTILHSALDRNFYSQQMGKGFDATVFIELLTRPEISATPWATGSLVVGLIFLLYILFISGGVLSAYHHDRKFTRGQFFEFCGDFFWRFVRLMLCSIVPFGIVFGLLSGVNYFSGKMSDNAAGDTQGFWFQVFGTAVVVLIGLFVRAWFDLAQARTVIDHVRGMFFLTFRSLRLALGNLPRFILMYLVPTLVAVAAIALTWHVWITIPHTSFGASWILHEVLSHELIGLRLWQRAAMILWYENYTELHAPPKVAPPPVLPRPVFAEEGVSQTEPVLPTNTPTPPRDDDPVI